jgi:hypothetical protein
VKKTTHAMSAQRWTAPTVHPRAKTEKTSAGMSMAARKFGSPRPPASRFPTFSVGSRNPTTAAATPPVR